MEYIEKIREKFISLVEEHDLAQEKVQVVSARSLTPEEAIGNPERKDFPLLKGKEVMVQAIFKGDIGQAYTDMPGDFQGTLGEVLRFPLQNNFQCAVFIASLNAVLRHLNMIDKTVHCRDAEPKKCADNLVSYVQERFGNPRIAFIGLQPAMVASLSPHFSIRVTDMDLDNIGIHKCGVIIESFEKNAEVIDWGDIVLSTGSTAVNGTLELVMRKKPVVFYGVTITGIAHLMNYDYYCHCGH